MGIFNVVWRDQVVYLECAFHRRVWALLTWASLLGAGSRVFAGIVGLVQFIAIAPLGHCPPDWAPRPALGALLPWECRALWNEWAVFTLAMFCCFMSILRFGGPRLGIVHRLGRLPLGKTFLVSPALCGNCSRCSLLSHCRVRVLFPGLGASRFGVPRFAQAVGLLHFCSIAHGIWRPHVEVGVPRFAEPARHFVRWRDLSVFLYMSGPIAAFGLCLPARTSLLGSAASFSRSTFPWESRNWRMLWDLSTLRPRSTPHLPDKVRKSCVRLFWFHFCVLSLTTRLRCLLPLATERRFVGGDIYITCVLDTKRQQSINSLVTTLGQCLPAVFTCWAFSLVEGCSTMVRVVAFGHRPPAFRRPWESCVLSNSWVLPTLA